MSFCYGFCYIPVCAPMIDWKIAVGFMLKLKNEFDWMNDEKQRKDEHRHAYHHSNDEHREQLNDSRCRKSSVRDDEDGHLIYHHGDWLQNRCTWPVFL